MMVTILLVIFLVIVTPSAGQYLDQYGNTLRHRGNRRGFNSLHPDNHVEHYGYGRYSDRYRNRDNGGTGTHAFNRRGEDFPRTVVRRVVTVTRVMQ